MKKINIKDLKTRVFKENSKYFKFISRKGITVYAVDYTREKNIRVYYKSTITRKRKNKDTVNESKKVCV